MLGTNVEDIPTPLPSPSPSLVLMASGVLMNGPYTLNYIIIIFPTSHGSLCRRQVTPLLVSPVAPSRRPCGDLILTDPMYM